MLIAGNWKMFKGPIEAADFCRALRDAELPDDIDVVVCPPYVSLEAAVEALAATEIGVFAQSVHWERSGPYRSTFLAHIPLKGDKAGFHVKDLHHSRWTTRKYSRPVGRV